MVMNVVVLVHDILLVRITVTPQVLLWPSPRPIGKTPDTCGSKVYHCDRFLEFLKFFLSKLLSHGLLGQGVCLAELVRILKAVQGFVYHNKFHTHHL